MDKRYLSRISRRLFGAFMSGLFILTLTTGCMSLINSTVKFSVRNTIGIVEKVPGVNLVIGGSSDLIINTMEMVENEIIVRDVINASDTITAKAFYGGKSWNKIRKRLRNPHAVALFLNTLDYQNERKGQNHTQTPEETLRLGGGDCEDFAYIVFDTLHYHGYETKMLSVRGNNEKSCHAVGIYKEKFRDKWHYIEESEVSEGFDSIYMLSKDVAIEYYGLLKDYRIFSTPEEFIEYYDN